MGVMAADEAPDKQENSQATNQKPTNAGGRWNISRILNWPKGWWGDLKRPEVSNRTIAVATVFVAIATGFSWWEVHSSSKQTDKIVTASQNIQTALDTQNQQSRDALDQTLRENRRALRRNLRQSQAAMDASNEQSRSVLNANISTYKTDQRAWVAEIHVIPTPYGTRRFERRAGEALHPEREPLELLNHIREAQGEYNFAGQYQQAPAPLGGGLVKTEWFKRYAAADLPQKFEMIFQSWDTANKPTELSDYSVCTTWGVKEKHMYLLHVCRKRLGYPELKRAVREQAEAFSPEMILVEDMASGTQLIQELISEGQHAVKKYQPTMDKTMRMHSVTSTMENGFVHLPDKAAWLGEYLHEMASFPKSKYDDQADSTSQALDWFKQHSMTVVFGLFDFYKQQEEKVRSGKPSIFDPSPITRASVLREWDRRGDLDVSRNLSFGSPVSH